MPNGGQWDKQAAFAAHTLAGTLFVTTSGKLVYSLPGKPKADQPKAQGVGHPGKHITARTPGWVLTETFIGANHQPLTVKPAGYRPALAKASYQVGQVGRHTGALDTFERVHLGEVFKGVEVELRATGSNVEKIFTVKPHQDPKQIHLRVAGVSRLTLGKRGELIAQTGNGPVTYTAPLAFQEDASGKRSAVKVAYALNTATHSYGFTVGDYNADQALVIDPLLQSTYLGGSGEDSVLTLTIHPTTGEVYVAGDTNSTTFPATTGGAQTAFAGAFVSRYNADLTVLKQSTYLGGTGGDNFATALAIHPVSGEVYVAGITASTDFPNTTGGAQAAKAGAVGPYNVFVSRFNADLTVLKQSTYLGGTGEIFEVALAIHPTSGEVYVSGGTNSTDFPGTAGGAQTTSTGGLNAFVSRFNASLTTLVQSTYLGGGGTMSTVSQALAIHPISGEVYVTGYTSSTDFPTTAGGAQAAKAGDDDAFLSRLNASLTTLLQSTYLGGAGREDPWALAIHPISGEVYVAGPTWSTDFPATAGGAQMAFAGGGSSTAGGDAFVSRFNANLTTLIQSTYLGGTRDEDLWGLAIHPTSGEVIVAGSTSSTNFPITAGGAQATKAGADDAFVSRFNANLTKLKQSTYLGGAGADVAYALAIHPTSGEVIVAGSTNSTNFPTTTGGAQAISAGGGDAFISRISRSLALIDTIEIPDAPTIGTATAGDAQATVSFTAPTNDGGSAITGYTVTSSPGGITASGTASPLTVTGLSNGTAYTFTVTASNTQGASVASAASNSVTPAATATPAPATSGGGGGGGSFSVPLLLALSVVYGLHRRKAEKAAVTPR